MVWSVILGCAWIVGCTAPQPRSDRGPNEGAVGERSAKAEVEITTLLAQQASAWNRGDIDGFMQAYWPSPGLTFSGGGQTRRGFATVRDRYKARYPTPERMGRLTFSDLEIRLLCEQAALVLGRWQLTETEEAASGNFSLVLQYMAGQWRIIHDHTSVEPARLP